MKNLTGKGKPFHSALDKGAALLKRKVGTGAEFMQELKGLGGIKQAEIDERKLAELMGLPKMTHDQFMAELAARPIPAIREKVFKNPSTDEVNAALEEQLKKNIIREYKDEGYTAKQIEEVLPESLQDALNSPFAKQAWVGHYEKLNKNPTEHGEWTLPGGENYREMLIKAPKGGESFGGVRQHFRGEPDILASLRLKDRIGPNGEKLLHVEELQSDWHQQGREKGYKGEYEPEEQMINKRNELYDARTALVRQALEVEKAQGLVPKELEDQVNAINDQLRQVEERKDKARIAVPDAPFKKNWEEMALKRLVHHAAENGYHGIVVTPGEEQADRYSLAKHIDDLHYSGSNLVAYDPEGNEVIKRTGVRPQDLPELVGKELSEKLMAQEPKGTLRSLSGVDLKVGGEGMKGFYDKKVPNILNGIGKKYGVKTQLNGHQIETQPAKETPQIAAPGIGHFPDPITEPAQTKAVHHFPITEDMRKDITTNGLPLYAEGGIIHKAQGGTVQPSLEQMKLAIMKQAKPDFHDLRSVGVNEAPGLDIKAFIPPSRNGQGTFPTGGVSMAGQPLPVGGVDMSGQQGNQLMPANMAQPAPQGQPGQPPQGMPSPLSVAGNTPPPQGGSNILQMTPQGQAMAAMKPTGMAMGGGVDQSVGTDHSPSVPQMVQGGITHLDLDDTQQLAKGGLAKKSVDQMKQEIAEKDEEEEKAPSKRITIKADGPGGVTGIVVPHHMLHGRSWISKKTGKKVVVPGMMDINKARAEVYGSENRPPLSIGQIGKTHKKALEEHFAKPLKEQLAAEKEATAKLRAAKHLGEKANTLDKSEKLDTVNHEEDDKGRNYIGFASKGVAGHALYTSGHGKNMKHHVINTCPGQTVGCGGGTDEHGVVDTSKGTCFAPNAESQYVHAAVRRATHEQAKHDPAMTKDWILAHTGSMRQAAETGDKKNKVLLFRPNVVDETDVSSRHVIRHLNKQRKAADKPAIVANSYGKTNELHDPENGYHVTYSNVGPKVKKGESIAENIARDRQRVRSTVHATDAGGNDIKNEEGNKTPPKNSYMVTDVKRGSPMAKKMEGAITHAKYWSSGRQEHELSAAEKEEGPEGHFGGNGKPTTEDKAHYGHRTHDGLRFDYQRQHILHPRLVQVGKNKDGSAHMIPTDSRFKDEEFLPKNRFKTKNGKNAGAILMTTPTESTSNIGHDTSFTHHVSDKHVEHALKNNGEYEIDKPEDQLKAKGKEYVEPRPITIRRAEGGSINVSDERGDDDFHAFPERNAHAQRHMTMRHDPEEADEIGHLPFMGKNKPVSVAPKKVKFHTDMDTINLELSNKRTKVK